ncbi:Gfo/Idh/MocA family protein [Parapedobacter lycopersici]|uniref:Gfo/Idh/MocA family protein n=1 Tax=Parapedobacter lycopersici TaxID=1864939 RepID=UPI00214D7F7D|nr:Gfo/Idh/MocA family oxidoreductase [Parapedobacter lycopersici]
MEKLNWGIIGCGDVTEVKSGPAFNRVERSALVAVMRRNAEKARDYAMRHGVPRWYDNGYDLINDPEVNAIYVATPPLYHEAYTIAALLAGKPVYVEKPMTMTAASAIQMRQASEQTGIKLTVAHYRRGLPFFNEIKRELASGAIGEVRLVNLHMLQPLQSDMIARSAENWRVDPNISGGGLFHDLAPHQLDLMLYFFGDPTYASGIALNQGKQYAADDAVAAAIQFQSGVLFNGLWSFTVPPEETKDLCEIIGTEGKLSFPVFGREYTLHKGGKTDRFVFDHGPHIQQPMIERVVAHFLDGAPNPCTAADGVKVMQLMDTITTR